MLEMAVVSFPTFFATIGFIDVVPPLAVQFVLDGIAQSGLLAS